MLIRVCGSSVADPDNFFFSIFLLKFRIFCFYSPFLVSYSEFVGFVVKNCSINICSHNFIRFFSLFHEIFGPDPDDLIRSGSDQKGSDPEHWLVVIWSVSIRKYCQSHERLTSDILRLGGILTGVSSSDSASAGSGTSWMAFPWGEDTLVTIVPARNAFLIHCHC